MPARKLPDNDRLIEWLAEGNTHEQIRQLAEAETGVPVTPVAVRTAISRLGLVGRRPTYNDWLPWTVAAAHTKDYPAVMLRAYARFKEAGDDPSALPDDLRVRLFNWLARMTDRKQVVTYDYNAGFGYADARRGEELVRRPPKQPRDPDSRARKAS